MGSHYNGALITSKVFSQKAPAFWKRFKDIENYTISKLRQEGVRITPEMVAFFRKQAWAFVIVGIDYMDRFPRP